MLLLQRTALLIAGFLVGGAVSTILLKAESTEGPNSGEATETSAKTTEASSDAAPKSACVEQGFSENVTALYTGLSCRVQCFEGLHFAIVAMPDGVKCGLGLMYRNRVCRKGRCIQGLFGDILPFKNE